MLCPQGLSAEAATYVREVTILRLNNSKYVPQAVDRHAANILALIKVVEPVHDCNVTKVTVETWHKAA